MEVRTASKILKRTIGISLSVMAVIYVIFSVLGLTSGYHEERKLWLLQKKFDHLARDPDNTPSVIFKQLEKYYQDFIEDNLDSPAGISAKLQLARVYVLQKDYAAARLVLEGIIQQYSDQPEVASEAMTEISKIYNEENKVKEEILWQQKIRDEYPRTVLGIAAPLRIYEIYRSKGMTAAAKQAEEEAIVYYRAFIKANQNDNAGFIAHNYLVKVYLTFGQWEEALNIYEEIMLAYPGTNYFTIPYSESLIRSINTIALTKANNCEKPIRIYERFIAKFPTHPLCPILKRIIQSLYDLNNLKGNPPITLAKIL